MARRPPGYRLRWPAGVTLWEPHRPALTALKEELLASAGPPARERRVVGGDLAAEGWPDALRDAGFRPDVPSAWLLEGLLYYLERTVAVGILRQAAAVAAAGSRPGADFVTEDFLTSPLTQAHVERMAAWGAPLRFGTNHPEDVLRSCGWDDVVMKEPGAGEGRWRRPVAPRSLPGVPRSFLVTAARR